MHVQNNQYKLRTTRRALALWVCAAMLGLTMATRANVEAALSRLDLSRPELAAVKRAVEAGKPDAAAEAMLQHFRTREEPRWYTDPPPAPKVDVDATDPAAEKILRREYSFVGKPATLTQDIDWNANPLKDHEWPIELNRHYSWVRLVDAYHSTGNPAYVDDLIAQLEDWCADNPRPPGPPQARYTWRTLECGIRLSGSWPRTFVGLLNSPAFTPETLCLMLESIWQQADYLTQHHGGGNWLITETAGLMTTAVLFPEFADAATWRGIAFDRLQREIDTQVLPDGAQVELTPHYHSVTMGSFMAATRIARHNSIEVPAKVQAGIDRMARYLLDISKPDLRIPMFNDSDHDDLSGRFRGFADDEHPHIQYVLSRGADGTAPDYTSIALPYAGQFIMRSGWDEQALYLAMDAGPFGLSHQHEDKLQIDVHAFGRSHILDPGRFTYAGGPWRHYFVSTQAHSTLVVNGKGQNRRQSPRRRWVQRDPQDTLWVTNETFDAAVGVYQDGYHGGFHDLTHIRKVFFKRGEYWVVSDLLVGPDEAYDEVTADVQYQFGTPGITVTEDGAAILSHNDDANLALLPLSDRSVQIALHEGEEDPPRGWIGWSLHRALKTPATLAVISQTASLPIRIDTMLMPYRGPDMPPVTVRRLPDDTPSRTALEIRGPDWRDELRWSHAPISMDNAATQPAPALIEWARSYLEGRELARERHDSAASGTASAGETKTSAGPLVVEPALRSLTVQAPTAGRLLVDYGLGAGGGILFQREQEVPEGESAVQLPSIRAGRPYHAAIRFVGEDGSTRVYAGSHAPEMPAAFDFEDDAIGEWGGGTITREEDNSFLRGQSSPRTDAVYLGLTHPLPRLQGGEMLVSLAMRMPFDQGGDWCYAKVSLKDTVNRRWSAYLASGPFNSWRRITLQRADFRRDDGGKGGNAPLPSDAVVTTLTVTVRKGATKAPVAAILDIDDVSWIESP